MDSNKNGDNSILVTAHSFMQSPSIYSSQIHQRQTHSLNLRLNCVHVALFSEAPASHSVSWKTGTNKHHVNENSHQTSCARSQIKQLKAYLIKTNAISKWQNARTWKKTVYTCEILSVTHAIESMKSKFKPNNMPI